MTALQVACAWLIGTYAVVLTGAWIGQSGQVLALALATVSAPLLAWRSSRLRLALLLLGVFFLAVARTASSHEQLLHDPLDGLEGPVQLIGEVVTVPDMREDSTTYVVAVQARLEAGQWARQSGRVWVQTFGPTEVTYGDLVRLGGTLGQPRERPGFSLPHLLKRQGLKYLLERPRVDVLEQRTGEPLWAHMHALRAALGEAFRSYLPEPQASLLAGILVGSRTQMPERLREALLATGTSHVVAVSGFNISILAGLAMAALSGLVGRRRAIIPALTLIAAYALLTGPQPSALRAALMGGAALVALGAGRLADPLTSLALVAAVMLAADPFQAIDLGFQLSFLATAGLVLLHPLLARRLSALPRWLLDPLSVTLAAQIATLPLLVAVFQSVSIVSPLANLLIAPFLPALMVLGGLLAALSPLPPLATLAAWPCWALLSAVVAVISWLGEMPGAMWWLGTPPVWLVVTAYTALLALGLLHLAEVRTRLARLRMPQAGPQTLFGGVAVVLLPLVAMPIWLTRELDTLNIVAWESGERMAILARTPSGRTLLIGEAERGIGLASAVAGYLRPWESRLGVLALPPESEITADSAIFHRYPPEAVLLAPEDDRAPGLELDSVIQMSRSDRASLDQDVWLEPVADHLDDARVLGWKLTYGQVSVLVVRDLEGILLEDNQAQLEVVVVINGAVGPQAGRAVSGLRSADLLLARRVAAQSSDDIASSLSLAAEELGSLTLDSDGRSILVRPGRCGSPFSPEQCVLELAIASPARSP